MVKVVLGGSVPVVHTSSGSSPEASVVEQAAKWFQPEATSPDVFVPVHA